MTLCVAAACQDRGKFRVIIGTDWKASIEIATADIQDKLYWVTDNVPVLIAGTITKAIDVKNTYRQFFGQLNGQIPSFQFTHENAADVIRRGSSLHKRKLVEQYISQRFGMTYKLFRMAVGKKEIPATIAIDAYSDIGRIGFDSHLIMIMFDIEKGPHIFRIDETGDVEHCESFAAIGTGSSIAESVLFQRQHEPDDPLGPSVYHVFEAMKLGSIASDVGQEHTIDVLYPPGERGETVSGDWVKDKTKKWLEKKFKKYGPKDFTRLPLPRNPFEKDF